MKKVLGVLLYDNVQPMDFIGLWEVLGTWKNGLGAPLEMHLISEQGGEVKCVNEITVKAHCDFSSAPAIDYLFIPGGMGRLSATNNEVLIEFIKKQAKHAEYILSVCTGMFLLYKAGLLDNKLATTYWRALPEAYTLPNIKIVEERIVKNGKLWLAGGVASCIDLAFEFIEEIAGKDEAGKVQLLFENFPTPKVYCSPKLADTLPLYYTAKEGDKSQLAKYIYDYIAENGKD
ncbi:Isonitrile hydratase [Legionella massiliensis]|uniref:Isonitrile hydratase n=1 Tax=Legionella massiliensis TaxID=1034943 RepID=A0A078KUA2_9GAMM|nr:DJ-1/PfpI family protein [Legionella massiliensis]CDZ76567.1 Isonitrile hydratase [Legionella massiliensis]CEE12305.1 Isonitrile hydratase [Legionella massiliensis]